MLTEKWDRRFLELAEVVASWSKDPSTKVGAVIVDPELRKVVGMGFNGFPRGVDDFTHRYADRPTKYKMVVHAEQNACWDAGHEARGATIYIVPTFTAPNACHECAKSIIQHGIKEIVFWEPLPDAEVKFAHWSESLDFSLSMFREVGIEWREVPRDSDWIKIPF